MISRVFRSKNNYQNIPHDAVNGKHKGPFTNEPGSSRKLQVGMYVFKSVCAYPRSDKSLSVLPEEMVEPWLPIELPLQTLITLRGCAV